jgi:phosphate transport system substrate-binding protein
VFADTFKEHRARKARVPAFGMEDCMGWAQGITGPALAAIVAVFLGLGASPGRALAETLKISGTGGAIGGVVLVARAFREANPGVKVVVPRSMGSTGGIRAAIAGKLDIGVSARPLTPEERSMGGRETPYARTPFVFAVNRGVVRSDITLAEAVDIYAGKTAWWEDGTPLRLVLRPSADTDSILLGKMAPGMPAALAKAHGREGMIVARTDKDCADRLENTAGAFGTTTLALVLSEKRSVKVLSLSGVMPSGEAVVNGTYPYAKTFHLVTGLRPSPAATRFIAFLRSPAGMSILLQAGHAPLP